MHIPDGYLSPATCGAVGAVMVHAWVTNRAMLLAVNLIHERTPPSSLPPWAAAGESWSGPADTR